MEEKKNNKKKILISSILGVITLLIVTLTITYAYWILTRQQTGENVVNTACLNISFTGENDINLDKAYPMNEEQLESFLSSATPYHFTIHNECSDLASATINLESLNAEAEKQLEDQYINAILYETDYHTNLNSEKKLIERIYNDENKVLENSLHAYSLYNFNLKPNETRDFNLLLYMDPETPMEDTNMNASWKGKITLSTGYKEDSRALRKISSTDNKGMWGFKDKLTSIVIEDSKSVKEALDGGKVYGPFDESEYGTKAVESYVVCETDDTNCVGYLQSDGKVITNKDSSYLFANFSKVVSIDGLEKIDSSNTIYMVNMFNNMSALETINLEGLNTSNVINMSSMFSGCSSLINLDLSMLNINKVSSISGIVYECEELSKLNISNWDLSNLESSADFFGNNINLETIDMTNFVFPKNSSRFFANLSNLNNLILTNVNTSHVTNMSNMFSGCLGLTSLNLSHFDTSQVTNMNNMFSSASNLAQLNISNWNLSNLSDRESHLMFNRNTLLETIDMTNLIFPKDSSGFFGDGVPALNKLILTNVNTSNTTNMSGMFNSCSHLTTLDLSSFDTSHVTNFNSMFGGMTDLSELNLSNWDLSGLPSQSSPNLFGGNANLETINMTDFVFPENSSDFFSLGLFGLKNIILSNADTSHVTNMSNMFLRCSLLTTLDLSSFNTSYVTNMNQMFAGTTALQSITFGPKFVHNTEATTSSMFGGCPSQDRPSDESWQNVSYN